MIEKFKELKVQGSIEIADWILDNIENYENKLEILKKLMEIKPEMNVIGWIYKMIRSGYLVSQIKDILHQTLNDTIICAQKFLNFEAKVLTISNSKTLEVYFKTHPKNLEIYIPKSNPGGEGEVLYKKLLNSSNSVNLIEDFEVHKIIKKCDYVIIGADSVCEDGVINKVGSKLLAILAEYYSIPFFVIADMTKFIDKVNFIGNMFEMVSNELVTAIISG